MSQQQGCVATGHTESARRKYRATGAGVQLTLSFLFSPRSPPPIGRRSPHSGLVFPPQLNFSQNHLYKGIQTYVSILILNLVLMKISHASILSAFQSDTC